MHGEKETVGGGARITRKESLVGIGYPSFRIVMTVAREL